jgi:MtrB/PioB family decaheme-associated outer membrane protein
MGHAMKTTMTRFCLILVAVLAPAQRARAQAAAQPQNPPSVIEVGPGDVTQGSYKAGEFNGLQRKGAFFIGNVDLRGGSRDRDSGFRWRIAGTDLGLDVRRVFLDAGAQGRYRFTFVLDQLRRNRSDTYQTPYLGTGSNTLSLPSSWLVPTVAGSTGSNRAVNAISARGLVPAIGTAPYYDTYTATPSSTMSAVLMPNATQLAVVTAAAAADVPFFRNVNLDTTRTRVDGGIEYDIRPNATFSASVRPEHKEGLKPMGTVSRNTNGDISTIIPDVIDTDTTQVDASLSLKGTRTFARGGYYGSFFKNNIRSMTWQNWATAGGTLNTMSSTPDNAFHQLNFTGSHKLSPTTKVVANASYARGTQNIAFLTDSTTPVVPVPSLNGLVVTTAVDAKFTAQPAKKLDFSAAYKYNDHDNRTPINIFQFADAGEDIGVNTNFPASGSNPYGAVQAQNANANRPYSKKLNQANLDAGYAIGAMHRAGIGYEFQRTNRSCPGSWINCADAALTNEHIARLEWRTNVRENLTARIGYERSRRTTPGYDENAFLAVVPYAGVVPAGQTISALGILQQTGLTGYGPILGYNGGAFVNSTFFPSNNALANNLYANGNRISELVGMRRYYVANRNRDRLRTQLSWQPANVVSLEGGIDGTVDDYPSSTYGLQSAKTWAAKLDGNYAPNDRVSADVFYTYETLRSASAGNSYTTNSNAATITNSQPGVVGLSGNTCDSFTTLQQRNNNNKIDPCLNWFDRMRDVVHTVGFSVAGKRVASSKVDVTGDFLVSHARSFNDVSGGNWANNLLVGQGAPPTTIAAYFIAATPLPTVPTTTTEVRLDGRYTIRAGRLLRVTYAYLRMRSSDWVYEGMQFGSLSNSLPTNEQPFNYRVNIFGVSYVLSF